MRQDDDRNAIRIFWSTILNPNILFMATIVGGLIAVLLCFG